MAIQTVYYRQKIEGTGWRCRPLTVGRRPKAATTKSVTLRQQSETRSAVERIRAFAATARPEHLTTDTRQLFIRNILDSIGCAIAAVRYGGFVGRSHGKPR
jgi:hypothetical protein